MNTRQTSALHFLIEHLEFFSAPFWNQYLFKIWVNQNQKRTEQIIDLTNKLNSAFEQEQKDESKAIENKEIQIRHLSIHDKFSSEQISNILKTEALSHYHQNKQYELLKDFKEALIGKGRNDTECLWAGDQKPIIKLLNNSKLVDVLYGLSLNPPDVIKAWEVLKPNGIIPNRKTPEQSKVLKDRILKLEQFEKIAPSARLEIKRQERKREEKERLERERLAKERREREEKERLERERLAKERRVREEKERQEQLERKRKEDIQALITDISQETANYLNHLSSEIIEEIQKSSVLTQAFENYYLEEDERKNYFSFKQTDTLAEQAKSGVIDKSLTRFMAHVYEDKVAMPAESKPNAFELFSIKISTTDNLKILAVKHHHAKNLQTIIDKKDESINKRIQTAKQALAHPEVRDQLSQERGFWSWLFEKLGLMKLGLFNPSHGKQLVDHFDQKYSEAIQQRVISENVELKR